MDWNFLDVVGGKLCGRKSSLATKFPLLYTSVWGGGCVIDCQDFQSLPLFLNRSSLDPQRFNLRLMELSRDLDPSSGFVLWR